MADLGRGEGQKSKGKKTATRQSRSCRVCRLRKVKVGNCLVYLLLYSAKSMHRVRMMDVFFQREKQYSGGFMIREMRLF
jgi:hypothetical protein